MYLAQYNEVLHYATVGNQTLYTPLIKLCTHSFLRNKFNLLFKKDIPQRIYPIWISERAKFSRIYYLQPRLSYSLYLPMYYQQFPYRCHELKHITHTTQHKNTPVTNSTDTTSRSEPDWEKASVLHWRRNHVAILPLPAANIVNYHSFLIAVWKPFINVSWFNYVARVKRIEHFWKLV